jgi:hypothetical protein
MRLFDSAKMYVFLFCVLALISIEGLLHLNHSQPYSRTAGFAIRNVVIALATVVMAVCLARLLPKLSSRIEQAGMVLTDVLCILWLANFLAELGVAWAEIPHGRLLKAGFNCAVTVLAGVRTTQVMLSSKSHPETR